MKTQRKAAQAIDRQLERYREIRDFDVTSEPRGAGGDAKVSRESMPFVVQKHAASHLHYDFRLGWHGVLKSWAVTKGPSCNPTDKRLAVQVEDHPMEYGGFEGTIPKGEYGGGTVMLWDHGDWSSDSDIDEGLKNGHLKFELHGAKLKGKWALVRMGRSRARSDKPNWLLIKEHDRYACTQKDIPLTEKEQRSAVTQRSMEEIAESRVHVWNSSRDNAENRDGHHGRGASATPGKKTSNGHGNVQSFHDAREARKEGFPGFIPPQLAQSVEAAPSGPDWIHELKLDGYRIQIGIETKTVKGQRRRAAKLLTRNNLDWTDRMPDIALAAEELSAESAILDGEVVVLDERGISNFADLQAVFKERRRKFLTYFAFDLLHLNGRAVRELPLFERKRLLESLVAELPKEGPIRMSQHLDAAGNEVFAKACELGAEGIISKLAQAKYQSGRSRSWVKVKCYNEQEFVIGGFTPASKGGQGLGALLLGYYDSSKLKFAGRSGTGFSQELSRKLRTQLTAMKQQRAPFAAPPSDAGASAVWVRPELVAQISFANWTRDGLLRQASFKGLREDKTPKTVVREDQIAKKETSKINTGSDTKRESRRRTAKPAVHSEDAEAAPLTHPEKVLDEASGLTKGMLAEYFEAVAAYMLPHIADRPLSVVRCPNGSDKPCFFQKHVGSGTPEGIGSVSIPNRKTGKAEEYLTVDSAKGLVGLAQLGVLEIHPWGSRNESLEKPDRIVVDLDPDVSIEWKTLSASALEIRDRLGKLGLKSFLKSTGGKGLHVVVPIVADHDWKVVKEFVHNFVLVMERDKPDLYVTKMAKVSRKNRIFLDYLRNDREATSIAPYSTRARSGAPVAMPLDWNSTRARKMPQYLAVEFRKWSRDVEADPWAAMRQVRQKLSSRILTKFRDN